jgi:hypothetical protein
MGPRWGISPTVAQIDALLFVWPRIFVGASIVLPMISASSAVAPSVFHGKAAALRDD